MANLDSTSYDNLIADSQQPIVTVAGQFHSGENLSRGALVGLVTATGLWKEADVAEFSDYDMVGVLPAAVVSDTDPLGDVMVRGCFTESGITYFYGDDADDWREKCAAQGIFLRKSQSVLGVD